MSDQERIAEILREQYPGPCDCGTCTAVWAHHVAGILNEEFHPVIETVEHLDALPDGAVIHVLHKITASSVEKRYDRWWPNRSSAPFHHGFRDELLPARVLYNPEADRDC